MSLFLPPSVSIDIVILHFPIDFVFVPTHLKAQYS